MNNILNLFKNRLNILFCLVFIILLFTPVLTDNEPATKPTNQEFRQKTAKLHMPFIVNNGQVDERVKFYAKTFGGTVFVTKEGKIVYALPANSSGCRGEWHSPKGIHDKAEMLHDHHISDIVHPASWIVDHDKSEFQNPKSAIQNAAVCHPECNEGSLVLKRDSSPLSQNDGEEPTIRNSHSDISEVAPKEDVSPRPSRERDRVRGICLKEELVGSKVKAIQGEEPSVTKVSYFKGNDPSKWKTNISTYDAVNLGEIYDGIELKLRAYGNNVEKLFCVKPGADPDQIKIRLSGAKDCGVQNAEITHPLFPSREGINPKLVVSKVEPSEVQNDAVCHPECNEGSLVMRRDASTSLSMTSFRAEPRNQNQKLQINNAGELEVETELGLVKFTKPIAYQEIEGKRVEIECKYTIADCGMRNVEITHPLVPSREGINPKPVVSEVEPSETCGEQSRTIQNDAVCHPECNEGSLVIRRDSSPSAQNDRKEPAIRNPHYGADPKSEIHNPQSEYGFTVASYDRTKPLIIDPLLASTYLGGSSYDNGYSLALDKSGNLYVTGLTYSTDFPTTSGAYDTSQNGSMDVFVSKLDGGLTSLLASTYLGGASTDYGYSLTLDTSGDVYVTGRTESINFPTTSGAYDTSYNGSNSDVFISKLDGGLSSLLASTYLGGSDYDLGWNLALDTSGNVYVTGLTYSTDFPTTSGGYDTSFNGGYEDVFVSKLDGGLSSLLASTYLGGSSNEQWPYHTLDTSGDVYVTGATDSTDFPTTSGAYDTSFSGGLYDVFISKLDGELTSLLTSTYLGGSSSDFDYSLTLDTGGNVYVTGKTESTDFPTTSGAYDTSFNGGYYGDVFISKLNSGLTSLLASTYLGGSDSDEGLSLSLDTSGNVYVTGYTWSTDFPTKSGAYDTSYNGGGDVFVSKLNSGLSSLPASTYLGGAGYESSLSFTLDTSGNVYVTGYTEFDFPTTSGAYDTSYNGNNDVFVSKLDGKLSADDSTCKADNIDVDPGDIEVQTGNGADETITITCADTVTPVSGETVKAKVKTGKDKVSVSPGSAVTDENGLTVFTIQGIKKGKAKVEFKDAAAGLKVKVKVTVIE